MEFEEVRPHFETKHRGVITTFQANGAGQSSIVFCGGHHQIHSRLTEVGTHNRRYDKEGGSSQPLFFLDAVPDMRACRGGPGTPSLRQRGCLGLLEPLLDFHGWPLYSQQNFQQKGMDRMPTFDQMPLQEALLKTATGKSAQITKEYLSYIEQLTEDQAGRLQPGESESVATVRRRLGVAAKLSGKDIIIKRQGNEVYFWVQKELRPRRQRRESQSVPGA